MQNFKERSLLFKIQKRRDPEAFRSLYKIYVDRIRRFVTAKVPNAQVAEEVLNDVFMKLWKYLLENEPVEYLQALTYRIARLTVVDYYRSRDPLTTSLDDDEHTIDVPSTDRLPERLDALFEVEKVQGALGQLKESYRDAILLRYFEGLDIPEIAHAIEKSEGTVRVLIHRALKALETILEGAIQE